ncbi:MAG: glycosyltransferase family 2 protein [Bdellovibrionales bacterium]|nr:glycosyltransferase family 2 protein [Bdellovibrionales bacterium]
MLTFIFWFCFVLAFVHYAAYPAVVILLARGKRSRISQLQPQPPLPSVTLIVAAYNEAAVIEQKIQNSLSLEYPKEFLEVMVVSDGSSDSTPERVACYAHQGVVSLHEAKRRGKTAALNRAVGRAKGEIVLFSDANTFYDPTAVLELVKHFADPKIGGVCGRKSILKEEKRDSSRGDGLFWQVESLLKTAESTLGSIPTADGEIFAIRKALYKELAQDTINDDTAITFEIVRQGYRVIYEPKAVSRESASITLKEDMAVKARMVYGGYQSLWRHRDWLLPPRDGFAVQFLLHKTLRHTMPFLLLGVLLSNLTLNGRFYDWFLACQVVLYLVAGVGAIARTAGVEFSWAYIPLYYCAMNISALTGFAYFIKGRSLTEIWTKAER